MSRRGFSPSTLAVVWSCFFAAGCAPSLEGNEPRDPHKEVPASFGAASTSDAPAQPASAKPATWRDFFDSAELRALIEAALQKNQELNIQLQEIIIAQNEVSARQGNYLPKVGIGVGAGVERVGKTTSQGVSDESHDVPQNLGDFSFGLWGSWEIDVWGKLRNAMKSADLRYLASIEGRNFMVTQIVAEIARSYFELIALDNQLDVLKRNVAILGEALEIVRLEKQAARVTELAVQRFEAEVLKNKSRLYDLEQERIQTENRINFLIGRFPQPVQRSSQDFGSMVPATIRTGIPSQLLANRPDIKQAELELMASKLDVKSARANFYPSLGITAGAGFQAFNGSYLFTTPQSLIYSLAGDLVQPLINRNAIKATYYNANAKQIQAVYNYERTILNGYIEVANQVSKISNLERSYALKSEQVQALTEGVEISNRLFRSARADYMEVLLTQRDALESRFELIETRMQQMNAVVNIYRALGGGWN